MSPIAQFVVRRGPFWFVTAGEPDDADEVYSLDVVLDENRSSRNLGLWVRRRCEVQP